jgi:putative membrane protein
VASGRVERVHRTWIDPRLADPAVLVLVVGLGVLLLAGGVQAQGPLTRHMIAHVAVMGVAAPAGALILAGFRPGNFRIRGSELASATVAQLSLLFLWHAPSIMALAMSDFVAGVAMHASLFAASLWFWRCIVATAEHAPWSAAAALVITGKVICLLAVLMVFAPDYVFHGASHPPASATALHADQQMAGLVMLAACPVIYVGEAVVIAGRWICRLIHAEPGGGDS